MSEFAAASAAVSVIKNVFDMIGGVRADKAEVFEKIIKPMHAEAEEVVTAYYKFFYFLESKVGKHVEGHDGLSLEDLQQINSAYSEGKAQRDGLRALANALGQKGKPRILMSYCASIERIFVPIIDIGSNHPSAGRQLVDISHIFIQEVGLSRRDYTTIIRKQVRVMEERWVAACQTYASICLRAYRR